ncbi:MAG: chemotaxis response regulator protein-glutamate methylesterase [Alphaproteobacteria bacterium]|nr:chemotaxis response regulator protein-glutamate methylesterase [Alphaproteobacteria bacterium]NDC56559.1 chemotaxis response regulator protein-glutamate methylesterase [Alphaproteobacteria bacterium]NDG04527.1 chemotaxis response regulator protein-glutamate methylesterase [Alphaproteobacteria bacterium]
MIDTRPISVLVVDDSALYRTLLTKIIAEQPDMRVAGHAVDPFDAREKIKQLNPDVVTLDVEMPGMDGLSFLEKIMTLRPMPVVMVSTLTARGTETAIAALQIGAIDCLGKPVSHQPDELDVFANQVTSKIRAAAGARLQLARRFAPATSHAPRALRPDAPKVLAFGASTGGVEALTAILRELPGNCPPMVITQHMPPLFTASFAARLSKICAFSVREAQHGELLKSGDALIAPGGLQMRIQGKSQYRIELAAEGPVSGHAPSVDVLFESVAAHAGASAVGIILTGMGKDGAAGLLTMRQSGAETMGQDETSCVVYGMPKAAFDCGAVAQQLPLGKMAAALEKKCFV